MSPQAVRLFDLALARAVLSLERGALLAWLDGQLPALKATTRRGTAALLEQLRRTLPPAERLALPPLEVFEAHWDDLRAALAEASDAGEAALATYAIAEKAAFGEERVEVDLPGGPAALFGAGLPDGALVDRDLFPGEGPVRYLLLRPGHAERLASALALRGEDAGRSAAALRGLAARCAGHDRLRLAWLLDVG
jgi:hypothetical protein